MGVIVLRDDGCRTVVKGNDDGGWSSDGVVLWIGRDKMETRLSGVKSGQYWDDLFIAVQDESRAV
jgi:hypothetical protein